MTAPHERLSAGVCTGPNCRQPIMLVVSAATGSTMPFSTTPDPAADWRITFEGHGGTPVARHIEQDELFPPDSDHRYRPHWADCPDADTFRKRDRNVG